MRSGLLSIILVTIILGFTVGLYTTLAFPNLGQNALRPGVASAGGAQGPPAIAGPRRAVQQLLNDNPYDHVVLLVGFVAIFAAITTGIRTRLEGDYRIRPIADAVITLAVISLMVLAIEMVVLLLAPILS
jgi:hypothetical protein